MTSAKAKNVIELRRLLAERFPGVRMSAGRPESILKRWSTAIPALDFQLEGGFPRSCLSEITSSGVGCGTSLLLSAMVRQAHRNGEWLALIDGQDSFDPAMSENRELSRLLWVRCSNPKEAMKAADLVLHDGTIPLIAIDLIGCSLKQLHRIPSSTWHRLARAVETTATVCVILTPEPMISTAEARLTLERRFTLDSLNIYRETLLDQIRARPALADDAEPRFRKTS